MVIKERAVKARLWLTPVLLLGAVLRLYGISDLSPPGLEHDEVANWLIDRAILAGNHALYFPEAYGHEAGFHYVQAAFVALIGDHALALRLPAAFLGLLGIAVAYVLARELFGSRTALFSAVFMAVLFYPVFYSRLGLRAIMLPVLSGLSAFFWWRGWNREEPGRGSTLFFVLAGLCAGLSLHTYTAGRVVPVFYALFAGGLALIHRDALQKRWRQVSLFWLVLAFVAAPLVFYLLTHPGVETRVGEVDAPLRALLAGNFGPVVDNFVDILGSFGFAGDPLWRQNVARQPFFDPLLAAFFYACLGLLLVYIGSIRHLFLILWVFTAIIPSIVTIDAPSSIRMSNIMPILTLLPAMFMHNLIDLSTENKRLSTMAVDKWLAPLLVVALLVFHAGRTARGIFETWPQNEEVRFVWQGALNDVAAYLDTLSEPGAVAIGGWTPDSMDPPTMALSLRREDLALRYFYPQEAVLLPAPAAGQTSRLLRPAILPVHPALEAALEPVEGETRHHESFTEVIIRGSPELQPGVAARVDFGGEVTFLGYTVGAGCRADAEQEPCQIITTWQVLRTPGSARRIFLHALDDGGDIVATGDALGAPAVYWQPGDLLLQRHELPPASLARYRLRLGLYDPQTGQRTLTGEDRDAILLQEIAVE